MFSRTFGLGVVFEDTLLIIASNVLSHPHAKNIITDKWLVDTLSQTVGLKRKPRNLRRPIRRMGASAAENNLCTY